MKQKHGKADRGKSVPMRQCSESAKCFRTPSHPPGEMAAYLEACIEEAKGDAAFIAKSLGDIARAKGMSRGSGMQACLAKAFIKRFPGREVRALTQFLKL